MMSISYLSIDEKRVSDSFDMDIDSLELEDRFATQPEMPVHQQPNEEELHTSFEAAISNRVCILHRQLSLKSGPLAQIDAQRLPPNTDALQYADSLVNKAPMPEPGQSQISFSSGLFSNAWQRIVIFGCTALMFMLTGFDLMGLLVLHAH